MYRVYFELRTSLVSTFFQSFQIEGVGGGFVQARVRIREDEDNKFTSETESVDRFEARSKQPFRVIITDVCPCGEVVVIDAVLDGQVQPAPRPIGEIKILSFPTCEIPHSPGRVSRQKKYVEG